jgi:hypothetical protein
MEKVQINYLSRDFNTIRKDLINYIKYFFPEKWQDFNVASPGMALIELNAYVGDVLSHITDKKYTEIFLDGTKSRPSIYRLAKTKGYKVPNTRPAIGLIDIVIDVPATAEGPDANYYPIYRRGVRVAGAGQVFETIYDIDFSSDYSEEGIANRTIEPILNGNQQLLKYQIRKREKISAGVTLVHRVVVGEEGGVPFYKLELPDKNVLEVISVIVYSQQDVTSFPTYMDFNDDTMRYYEVDHLPQKEIFFESDEVGAENGIKSGYWKTVTKRFEKEFMADGTCVLTFGGGDEDYDAYQEYLTEMSNEERCNYATNVDISDILNNTALGQKIPKNCTIFVQYRAGGGILSNVGSNVLNTVSNIDASITGPNQTINTQVVSSTKANNVTATMGGKGMPTVEEIRHNIAANHAAQDRCVTLTDYISRAYQMPGKYGAPFKIHGVVDDNKVKFYILSRGGDGKLISSSTSLIKQNIVNYISKYRMINDYVEVNDGQVINLEIRADLFIDRNSFSPREIKSNAASTIAKFMDVDRWEMNQHIYVSQLVDALRDVPGVINVVNLDFFNLEGGGYSNAVLAQATGPREIVPETSGFISKIELFDNAIFSTPYTMFEVRNPDKDIKIRVG